jgi:hypothetical protein
MSYAACVTGGVPVARLLGTGAHSVAGRVTHGAESKIRPEAERSGELDAIAARRTESPAKS